MAAKRRIFESPPRWAGWATRLLGSILGTHRVAGCAIDETGNGMELAERMEMEYPGIVQRVSFTNPLGSRDSTYGSATVSWEVTDPDGGGPGLHYRIWLDGNQADYVSYRWVGVQSQQQIGTG